MFRNKYRLGPSSGRPRTDSQSNYPASPTVDLMNRPGIPSLLVVLRGTLSSGELRTPLVIRRTFPGAYFTFKPAPLWWNINVADNGYLSSTMGARWAFRCGPTVIVARVKQRASATNIHKGMFVSIFQPAVTRVHSRGFEARTVIRSSYELVFRISK